MSQKQPIYTFNSLAEIGIFEVPLGSIVSVVTTGDTFSLSDKSGLDASSTVQDAINAVQNNTFKSIAGTLNIAGSDTVSNILAKPHTTIGETWLATDTGVDSSGVAVAIGDGLMANGSGWNSIGPIRGPAGATGATGGKGDKGLKGDKGDKGDIGLTGGVGPTGADSTVPGPTGAKGDKGDQGIQGSKGDTGVTGADGLDATVEFASQAETDQGLIDDKAISPRTLGAAGNMPREDGNEFMTVTNNGVRKDSYWSPFVSSPNEITKDFTLGAGQNASIVSPIINDGITITIPDGSSLVIL